MQPLRDRSFVALLISQALGAFNDNVFRQYLLLLAAGVTVAGIDGEQAALGIFALPFVMFGLFAGSLADRYSKRNVIVSTNVLEIVAMTLGTIGFYLAAQDVGFGQYFLMGVLFLMGFQSALFGPAKYGILPELLDKKQLGFANGLIGMTTQVSIIVGAIIAGTIYARVTADEPTLPLWTPGAFCLVTAVVGFAVSLLIRKVPAADPARRLDPNPIKVPFHFVTELKWLGRDRELLSTVLANAWFYLIGGLALTILNEYGANVLELDAKGSDLFALLGVGIALGSFIAGSLMGGRPELGLVPIGAIGLGLGLAIPGFTSDPRTVDICMVAAGTFGGVYLIPLLVYQQYKPDESEKGRVLGFSELASFLFIIGAAGVGQILSWIGLDAYAKMKVLGALTIVGGFALSLAQPVYFQRAVLVFLIRPFYRFRVIGSENIPRSGGVLFVANHASYADPFLLSAASTRIPRFIMHRDFMSVSWIRWFANAMRVIPIASTDGRRALLQSLDDASGHLADGEACGLFPEGKITRTGHLLPFFKGVERIARKGNAQVVPCYIDGAWGSLFSYQGGRAIFKRPKLGRRPVTVIFGEPLPSDTPVHLIRQKVQELGADALDARRRTGRTLATEFVRRAKRGGGRLALADSTGKALTFRKALVATLILRSKLRARTRGEERVGVLLPSTVGGVLANLALALMNRTAVNLNFTIGDEAYRSAIEQSGIRTIITSKKFLKKIDKPESDLDLAIEDVLGEVTTWDRVKNYALSFLPTWLLARLLGLPRDPDAIVTILFSSGSTGIPKGVPLSHHNVLSEIRAAAHVFNPRPADRLIGILPLFHAFGYSITIWLPLIEGFAAIYHPNPLDSKTIAELIRKYEGTIFIATPTFYQSYLRRFTKEDVKTLRIAAAGAEKLKASLLDSWRSKFDMDIHEGYGCTELSPAISINVDNIDEGDVQQTGYKPGSIGHPFPGVATRIVDPDSGEDLPPNEEGLLLVRGPMAMKGYLDRPEATAEVFRDGWYVTGDIGLIDDDGFVHLTGRLSRFSKIGGEMVPHVRVEEAVQIAIDEIEQCDSAERVCPEAAVTAVPHPTKGEKLIVVVQGLTQEVATVHERLKASELPKLWLPQPDAFVEVEEIPKLGSGKLDLKALAELARTATEDSSGPADSPSASPPPATPESPSRAPK